MSMTSPIVLSFVPESAAATYLQVASENSVGNDGGVGNNSNSKTHSRQSVGNNNSSNSNNNNNNNSNSNNSSNNNNNDNDNDNYISRNYRYQLRRPSVKCGDELWPQVTTTIATLIHTYIHTYIHTPSLTVDIYISHVSYRVHPLQ